MRKVIFSIATLAILATIFVSCNKKEESLTPEKQTQPVLTLKGKELTENQKKAMFWTDWCAGVASVSFAGPYSFAIAAAASLVYYYDHIDGVHVSYDPDTIPSNEEELNGYYHNKLCKMYIEKGYTNLNFIDLIKTAKEMRPDIASELDNIPESNFNEAISYSNSFEFINSSDQMSIVNTHIPLSEIDANSFQLTIEDIIKVPIDDQETFVNKANDLITQVRSYSISYEDQAKLINSLVILKHSRMLWQF
ncbi:MAG: hypothetical protein WCO13_04070 [Bacteroidota bacterium]